MGDEERRDTVWEMWVTLSSCLWPTWVFAFFSFSNETMWSTSPSLLGWLTRESSVSGVFHQIHSSEANMYPPRREKMRLYLFSDWFFEGALTARPQNHMFQRCSRDTQKQTQGLVLTWGPEEADAGVNPWWRLYRGRQTNLRETHETCAICLFCPCCGWRLQTAPVLRFCSFSAS